ncbi:hypothetical protein NDU88_004172 [Pleurodeles waltl]|uniref:Uncharacterized protein n=1 Tax=Pleurodeles waltl TaxID=8319 RepID=A0AAV7L0L1_PLEWA|nr:hypothetical protein NDU88_004172 [Pleurodeles waltl]
MGGCEPSGPQPALSSGASPGLVAASHFRGGRRQAQCAFEESRFTRGRHFSQPGPNLASCASWERQTGGFLWSYEPSLCCRFHPQPPEEQRGTWASSSAVFF